ncbi:Hsp70 family protein [Williamsia muralis]|uniref:Hsp70 family protein n=1 Tax=Williamsia marianensis TaxID=85044 RepID=UPI000DE6E347|nr:Hsp70 family protein [Williamsia marianensis]PVY27715.1 Hsp70 protein [Williamsia marianensis]
MSNQWWLAIDFGTSNTAAAAYEPGHGAPQVVPLSHNSDIMSSSVYADSYRNIVVGEAAVNQAGNNPAAFITHPKRHINAGTVPVGNLDLPLENLIAAVLNSALTRAAERRGGTRPTRLILTHPVAWSPEEVDILTRAAELIGFDRSAVTLISEPRAAIAHYTSAIGDAADAGSATVVVVDYGGGTCDVAVVKLRAGAAGDAGPIDLVAHDGNNGLGGKNLDAMIRRWVDKQLTSRNPELLEYLRTGANLSTKRAVDDNIRRAKELLSESPRAVINISAGGHEATLELTRGEFEQLISQNVDAVVELTSRTLARAGAGRDVRIYLTGGSSRVPLVHQRLGELGTVATLDNPKTVVALGALESVVGQQEGAAAASPGAPMPPVVPVPLSKTPEPPQPAQSTPSAPSTPEFPPTQQAPIPSGIEPPPSWGAPAAQSSGYAQNPYDGAGGGPYAAGQAGTYGQEVPYGQAPFGQGSPYGPAGQQNSGPLYGSGGGQPPFGGATPATPPNPNRNRNIAIAGIAAVVVVLVVVILGVALASSGGDDDPKAQPGQSSTTSTTTTTTTTRRTQPTTETSTASTSLDADDQALADANTDLVDITTCGEKSRPDYALAAIVCEPAPAVVADGTGGVRAESIVIIESSDSNIKAIADKEYSEGNSSEMFSRPFDGGTTYAYFAAMDNGGTGYFVYSEANSTVTWWVTTSPDQAAFTAWLQSAGICLC